MRRLIERFRADTSGATAIEYALIAAGLSIVIVGAVTALGTSVTAKYTSVGDALKKQ
ncbi:Flp family type IVb pilin [Rhodopseudomonas parapalustris]